MRRDVKATRFGVLGLLALFAIPLAVASTAWACGRLATLYLNPAGGRAGAEVTGVGRNYNSAPTASEVTVRFNGRNGRVLWQGRADQNGRIFPSFQVPNVRAGNYVVLATQSTADGRPAAGTPGRSPLRVRRGSSSTQSAAPLWAPSKPGDPGPSAHATAGSGGGASGLSVPAALLLLLALPAAALTVVFIGRRSHGAATPARRFS